LGGGNVFSFDHLRNGNVGDRDGLWSHVVRLVNDSILHKLRSSLLGISLGNLLKRGKGALTLDFLIRVASIEDVKPDVLHVITVIFHIL
jgi:hypothetical protein